MAGLVWGIIVVLFVLWLLGFGVILMVPVIFLTKRPGAMGASAGAH